MARSRSARGATPRTGSGSPTRRPLLGVLMVVIGALITGSVLSSTPWEGVGPFLGLPSNACGMVGEVTAAWLLGFLGLPLTLVIWATTWVFASRCLVCRPAHPWHLLAWSAATALSISFFLTSIGSTPYWGAGPVAIMRFLGSNSMLGPLGAGILSGGLLTLLLFFGIPRWLPSPLSRVSLHLLGLLRERCSSLGEELRERLDGAWEAISAWRPFERGGSDDLVDETADADSDAIRLATSRPVVAERQRSTSDYARSEAFDESERARVHLEADYVEEEEPEEEPEYETGVAPVAGAFPLEEEIEEEDLAAGEPEPVNPIIVPHQPRPKPTKTKPRKKVGDYMPPPLDLLEEPPEQVGTVGRDEVLDKSRILVKTLQDFGIEGRIGEVHPGPVITQYEYEPAAGVRISQVVSRADDIALALRAARIRMVAPIPGKGAIGIEVPNRTAEQIYFLSVFQEIDLGTARLPLCLGRDIRGRPQFGQLDKMPHLLVAGTTGSGKSVCLNVCIFSLLYHMSPDELRLLMIDPKMLELTVYDGIPHLLCPVVTDARMAARMLEWMVGEMERRYRKMAAFGVRNIEGYSKKVRDKKDGTEGLEPMPYIVVIVDELADLMLTLAREIETPIARLAQMARAVGIHLILATQRPSVDVITGVIKANFPGRIAFQVATKVDSRTIIDVNGAETLLGKGDMLYLPPGKGQSVRLHGAFVSDKDAENLVRHLREQPEPEPIFREEMLDEETGESEINDELFIDALRLVVLQKQASVSFLQRRLKIGYSRAGRLMDLLESVRAVGPHEGSKPREVIADERFLRDWLDREEAAQGAVDF